MLHPTLPSGVKGTRLPVCPESTWRTIAGGVVVDRRGSWRRERPISRQGAGGGCRFERCRVEAAG
eukprot:9780874-Prorocentrum_lima.AAC.1